MEAGELECVAGARALADGIDTVKDNSAECGGRGGFVVAGIGVGYAAATGRDLVESALPRHAQGICGALNLILLDTAEARSSFVACLPNVSYQSHRFQEPPTLSRLRRSKSCMVGMRTVCPKA